jgi:hypothetical protein
MRYHDFEAYAKKEGLPDPRKKVTRAVLPDGTIVRRFPDGTLERIAPDGTVTIEMPDGTVSVTTPEGVMTVTASDGTVTIFYPDGTAMTTLPDGTTIKTLPDGTIIKMLPDGTIIKTLPETFTGFEKEPLLHLQGENGSLTQVMERVAESGPECEEADIQLTSVVAGLSGWGLSSPRYSGDGSRLDREGFKRLDRENKNRRFLRWRDGRFKIAGQ